VKEFKKQKEMMDSEWKVEFKDKSILGFDKEEN
jgi:hypothetical protein